MPELPEVQTVVSDLNKKIVGDTITDFWSDWPKTIKDANSGKPASSADKFKKEIKSRKILKVRRIGKNIFIDLAGNPHYLERGKKTIYIHLKMTGHLLVKTAKTKNNYFNERVNQYIHHIWKLKTKNKKLKTLEFSDLRKFGKIVLVDTDKLEELKEIKELGIDVMDNKFTFQKFDEILEKKSAYGRSAYGGKKIRDILMNQHIIAGIGNIYLSEILFDAGIMPTSLTWKLSFQVRKKLYNSIRKILEKAIKLRGTSDSDYRDTSGAPGKFQKVLKVYQHEGQKCLKCDTIIKRVKMGQRSVFYCSKCQK
ncbi:formamidopyrimidine-DNA glycosylase [bacterium BMS3Abin15]|nr:formamidopyrimidine-DNA glycosylase [bacterium BMS3Abin15]HDH07621.1 bifunctional DNA-formamidopyrimidine glycosylase/DNA-(apurinic or apyrimidinic site) lyase [Candidatus Moranbacteria bacterium]